MHRKVRVNVTTFGWFADSVNHQQQHRRSWAHAAVLTDAREISLFLLPLSLFFLPPFLSFSLSLSFYSSLLVLHVSRSSLWHSSAASQICVRKFFPSLSLWQIISITQESQYVVSIPQFVRLRTGSIVRLINSQRARVCELLCSNCAFICYVRPRTYDRDKYGSVDSVQRRRYQGHVVAFVAGQLIAVQPSPSSRSKPIVFMPSYFVWSLISLRRLEMNLNGLCTFPAALFFYDGIIVLELNVCENSG